MQKFKRQAKRTFTSIVGGVVLLVGIVAIPYPGPGWLIVFAGLAILATEFDWARRILNRVRAKYDAWQAWLAQQPKVTRVLFWALTCVVVIVTIWLLNGYGLIDNLFDLNMPWVHSPLPVFR